MPAAQHDLDTVPRNRTQSRHPAAVGKQWMFQVTAACQRAVCRMAEGQSAVVECERLVDAFLVRRTRLEELIMFGALFELALRAPGTPAAASPPDRIKHGLRVLLSGLNRARQRDRSNAGRVAHRIVQARAGRFDLNGVAGEIGCHVTTLRRLFKDAFGMSMREYQRRVRVWKAACLFATGTRDVVAVARSIGYRSDKNFYRAVRDVTGLTPAQLRDSDFKADCRACRRSPGNSQARTDCLGAFLASPRRSDKR
jgi:AraC-like DNA-binding protein